MNQPTPPPDDSWESDAVWKLLDRSALHQPSLSFTDDVVRMARLSPMETPWWKRGFSPAPLAGLAAAAAAIALGFTFLGQSPGDSLMVATPDPISQADPFADIQDFAETEALLAAADHLDDFSDQELVSLIGL